jgi:hypothetical protein
MSWFKLETHQFCEQCGARNLLGLEYIDRYDIITGFPILRRMVRCPNYNFMTGRLHFKEEFEGDDMCVERHY